MSTDYDQDPVQKWIRKNYDEAKGRAFDLGKKDDRRKNAELETARDLQKPVDQLVCDVHEEATDLSRSDLENIAGAQKRMVSLMARVAQSNDIVANRMLGLTWAVALMTGVILLFTVLLWYEDQKSQSTERATAPSVEPNDFLDGRTRPSQPSCD